MNHGNRDLVEAARLTVPYLTKCFPAPSRLENPLPVGRYSESSQQRLPIAPSYTPRETLGRLGCSSTRLG